MPSNPSEPDPSVSPRQPAGNAGAFYAELFNQLPVLVARLTTDGIVLEINTQVTLVTGYAADQLVGRNFWATLFPGKLFAQVPRFISPVAPWGLFRDYPMALRTRNGFEKIIAWTRFLRQAPIPPVNGSPTAGNSTREEVICIGLDLTNRLTAAESQLVEQLRTGDFGKNGVTSAPITESPALAPGFLDPDVVASLDAEAPHPRGASRPGGHKGAGQDSDGGTIEPLAVSPPPPPRGTVTVESLANLQQALDLLAQRLEHLQAAGSAGQVARLDLLSRLRTAGQAPTVMDQLAAILHLEKGSDPQTLGLIETMHEAAGDLGKLAGRGKTT